MATYDVKQIALPGGDIANLKDGNAIHKSDTSGFVKNDGSIDQNTYQIAQEGKGLSTNDFTNEDKALIGQTLGNNTVLTTDKTPFLTRQTLNPTGFSGYVREKLVGASYAWNNVCSAYNNYALSSTASTQEGQLYYRNLGSVSSEIIAGHKYFVRIENKNASSNFSSFRVYLMESSGYKTILADKNSVATGLVSVSNASQQIVRFYATDTNTCTANLYVSVTDLTLAFGSTIADYLYGLANNGGITKLRDMGCPIDTYTPYGYGLYSVKTSGKKITFKNLVDYKDFVIGSISGTGEDNNTSLIRLRSPFIRVAPNTTYAFSTGNSLYVFEIHEYVAEGNWIKYTGINATSGTLTVSANTNLVKVLVRKQDNSAIYVNDNPTFQMEKGSQATAYTPYAPVTYSLGNDELRGKFDLVNGEIVASGDVKESNGNTARVMGIANLGDLTWNYDGTFQNFYSNDISTLAKIPSATSVIPFMVCAKYDITNQDNYFDDKTVKLLTNGQLWIKDASYNGDVNAFKMAMSGIYLTYEKSTPTTEQSTPFADPMSMVGATTEEYIDTRDIPCPVGAERQYMGQSEDVVKIPSTPQSDGVRYLKSYKSGNQEQLVWEGEGIAPVRKDSINIKGYTTENNAFTCPCDGYIFVRLPSGSGHVLMRLMDSLGNVVGTYTDAADAEEAKAYSVFVKRGIKTYAYCYVGETLEYTYWFYGIT